MSSIMVRSLSAERSKMSVTGASGTNCRLRTRFRTFSRSCASSPTVENPKKPAAPLIE